MKVHFKRVYPVGRMKSARYYVAECNFRKFDVIYENWEWILKEHYKVEHGGGILLGAYESRKEVTKAILVFAGK